MSLRRVWAVARKEFLHVVRDIRSLGMGIAIPMIMLVLFGSALTLDVDNVPLAVWDQSHTPESRELLSRFTGSSYFAAVRRVDNYRDIVQGIDSGQVMAALVIPRDFAQFQEHDRTAPVQLILDGSDSNTATIVLGYADAVVTGYSQEIVMNKVRRAGGKAIQLPLDPRPRVWFNADLLGRNYIIPGLIAVIMMVIAALLTSLTVAREWERGTMEQLISTPVKTWELIAGKLVPYFTIGMLDMLLAVLVGVLVFRVPLCGSLLVLFAISAVFLLGALSMGILISIVTKNQLLASQLAMVLTFLPAFLLSGFMVPISNMPAPIQVVTYAVPARYFVTILRAIYLKGVGLSVFPLEALLLTAFAVLMFALANLKFKKKLG
jgi:ABC-2 type transport system permease protein